MDTVRCLPSGQQIGPAPDDGVEIEFHAVQLRFQHFLARLQDLELLAYLPDQRLRVFRCLEAVAAR